MQTNNYPQNHCYNPQFKYVPADLTNVRDTFERIRTELSNGEVREVQHTEVRRQLGWFLK
jgi:hypothetical protein